MEFVVPILQGVGVLLCVFLGGAFLLGRGQNGKS